MHDMRPLQDGIDVIKAHAAKLGQKPGVYQMVGKGDETLYVGKAKALKRRVFSYTQPNRLSSRLMRMVSETLRMEFVETHTEAEALLLEANLIKKHRPRYNILLKDDKSFPYILLTGDHDFPRLTKHRGAKTLKGDYFGPFASIGAVNHTLTMLQRIFMVRNCSDSYFANRTRPCLQYHIKRCTAPCTNLVSKQDYARQTRDVKDYLSGKSRQIQDKMAEEMQQASDAMEFEKAAALRDRIRALSTIQMRQDISIPSLVDADVIAGLTLGGKTCVQVFFFRSGQSYGNRSYFPRADKDDTLGDILGAFMAQFYADKPVPKEVITNAPVTEEALLTEALSHKSGYKVTIKTPLRGDRKRLVDWAENNIKAALERHLQENAQQASALSAIADLFGMDTPPQRIEIYDNSHISGTNMTGVMVVAGPDGFIKNQYRKFNIKQANAQDDFDMMREVMMRRFSRALKDNKGNSDSSNAGMPEWPDLLLIDGGKGQLSAVSGVLEELGILDDLTVVAISKGPDRNAGREEFHMNGRESFRLPINDPSLFYLQRLRDESHRFAIGAHRQRRAKGITKSTLDQIPGIGPKRKKALLVHFGSAKAVEDAGIADLLKVEGISESFAQSIYDYFHDA